MLKRIVNRKRVAAEILKVSPEKPSRKILERAAELLKAGGILIYPTDTLYGFGVLINNRDALEKMYQIKKRDPHKPFSILVNSREQAEEIAGRMTLKERRIFELLLPGKVTLLIKARKQIEIPGLEEAEKIGFRIPDSNLCRQLVRYSGGPVSSSSVNISKKENLGKIEEISLEFGRKVDLILNGGQVKSLKGSSIIDISTLPPVLVREGEIPQQILEKKLGVPLRLGYNRKFIITFICSGNICRSPMAQGILRKKLDKDIFKDKIEVNSAGTLNLTASTASVETVKIAAENQVDLSTHLSHAVDRLTIDRANLVLCMAEEHYTELTHRYPEDKEKIFLLKRFEREGLIGEASIEDPMGRDEKFYRQIYGQIEQEIERILPFIMKRILRYVYNL